MAISRVIGASLVSDLDRQGVDLQFTTSGNTLVHMDFANFRLGVNQYNPQESLHVNGNVLVANGHVYTSGNLTYDIGSETNWFRNVYANNIAAGSFTSGTLTGTLLTNAQPNITSLGTLTGLAINGNLEVSNYIVPTSNVSGNIGSPSLYWDSIYSNVVYATGYYGNILTGNQPYITDLANVTIGNLVISGGFELPGNVNFDIIYANALYDSGNRVTTEATTININGDVSGSGNVSNIFVSLQDTGVTAGIYGSADDETWDRIPKITVDSKGRITNIANITLTQVGNVTFTDTTISSTTSLTLQTANNGNIYLDANGSGTVQFTGNDAMWLPSGNTLQRPANPEVGYFRYNTDAKSIEFWDSSTWVSPGVQPISSQVLTPNGVDDSFTLSDEATPESLLVMINGTLQQPSVAYTVSGNVITFSEIPLTSDVIEIRRIASGGTTVSGMSVGPTSILVTTQGNLDVAGNLVPTANLTYNLGSPTNWWKDLYLSGTTIYLGGMAITNNNGVLTSTVGGNLTTLQADDPVSTQDVVTLGYLQTQLSGLDSTVIQQDDTSVQIIDDGVDAGNIVVAVDGSNVAKVGADRVDLYRNVQVTGNVSANVFTYPNGQSILDNVTSAWQANAGAQADSIATLTANAASQAGTLSTIQSTYAQLSGATFTGALVAPNLTLSSTPLAVTSGGTGATTTSGVGGALDNLLPSGEQTGYVLSTSGAGSYSWVAPSAGGATVGQQLTTTRQANAIVSNTTVINLAGISYTPGAGQLRVYINGVRQFPSAYTETSNVSYTLSANVVSGDTVFTEIDAFSSFNNYANLTYASNIGNIAAVGLTVQSAIQSLETNKAPLASPVFSGDVTTNSKYYGDGSQLTGTYDNNSLATSLAGGGTYANTSNWTTSTIWQGSTLTLYPAMSVDMNLITALSQVATGTRITVVDAVEGTFTTTLTAKPTNPGSTWVLPVQGSAPTDRTNITSISFLPYNGNLNAGTTTISGNVTVSGNVKFTGWHIYESGTNLYFAYNGVNKMSLNTNGNLTVTGDVTGFGTP